jgi:hypothetical protein
MVCRTVVISVGDVDVDTILRCLYRTDATKLWYLEACRFAASPLRFRLVDTLSYFARNHA